jgi:hypothetical protein
MASNGYDYESAKADALKGLPMTEIATKYGIPYATLQQYAYRHKWTTDKTRIRQVVSQTVEEGLADLGQQWLAKISAKANDVLSALSTYDLAGSIHKLKPLEYISAIETVDRIARRTYGHDAKDAFAKPASLTVNVAVSGSAGQALAMGQVIDAELVSEAGEQPAQLADAQPADEPQAQPAKRKRVR